MDSINKLNNKDNFIIEEILFNTNKPTLITAQEGFGVFDAIQTTIKNKSKDVEFIQPVLKNTIDFINGTIGVDEIRSIQLSSSHKSSGLKIICISKAESMTKSAQNAFLKLLEEPNISIKFILCSERPELLLKTISSRVQRFNLSTISRSQSIDLIKYYGVHDEAKLNQILFLATGLPSKIKKLCLDNEYFEYVSGSVRSAMALLSKSEYEKISIINQYKDDRHSATELIDNLLIILKNNIFSKKDNKIITKIEPLINAKDRINSGGNVRLNLLSAVL